ncbi:hypothetical protein FCR2A7T_08350 [Flavobacterium cauense R2A-7]|uniref:Parallel beta helix pectate lyase-like protein n=1 Tax=Flavobacterium cauense R2A-7 TaxID=1341154 RepID=V6S2A4_9FLAO|nr:hypothetical protein [Flavobacterium cauense]ESU20529.1 hypothetical protein FCR2A7T_08350 [Flavobacterium cauense R2A-7]TWI10153.1 hypothetical protein IP98_02370 [Flavobacterium cauense R2A-7]
MKKKLLFIAIAGLFTSMANAADLYVRATGTGGAYTSVSAAITAANNGDRIIIQPKTDGSAYIENLTINKSLTFVSETNYNKYFIRGTININPAAGRVVTISNLSSGNFTIYNIVATGATTGGRTTINLYNCYLNNVDTTPANTTTNMSGCTVSGYVFFSHGRMTGNNAQRIMAYNTSSDNSLATNDIEIIGNATTSTIGSQQTSYNFKFYNNFTSGFGIYNTKTSGTNEIVNNTIYEPNGGDIAPIYIGLNGDPGTGGNITIMNNAISFVVAQTNACIQNINSVATVTASYNVSTNAFVTEGTISQSNNTGAANMNFNNTAYTVTGMNVNAGNPAVSYTDLDLTRNDAGHYGGSNSWANYFPADNGGRPQVNYLVTPRAVLSTGTLNVSGSAYSK